MGNMRVCLPSWATRLRGTNDSSRERGGRERMGQEVLWKALEGSETWPGLGGRTDTLQPCSEHCSLRGLWSALCVDQTHAALAQVSRVFGRQARGFPGSTGNVGFPRACSEAVQHLEHPLRCSV